MQGLYKFANGGIVDLILILDNGAEDLRDIGVIPEVFLLVSQISSAMVTSKAFPLQVILL